MKRFHPNHLIQRSNAAFQLLLFIYFLTSLAPFSPVAAEDAYHAGLRAMLQSQYGVTGGAWLLGDSEETTLGHAVWSRVTTEQTASDQPSFTQTLHLGASEKQPHSWDAYIRFPAALPTLPGDALLLMVWINSGESVKSVTHVFESDVAPYTKSLYANAQIQPEWQLWILPFTAQSSGGAHFQLNLGGLSGTLQMSAPAILNFAKKYRTYELPVVSPSLAYEGREEGAAWRTAALQRIEEIRQGDMQIQVVNSLGEAVQDAQVQLTMKQHDFGFGTAIPISPWLQPSAEGNEYLAKLMNLDGRGHGFNVAVLENALKWPVWENESLHGSKEQVVQVVKWLREHGFRVRGHNLIWPSWVSMPADLKQNSGDLSYLENRIRDHFFDILTYPGIKGEIDDWDVLNEPVSCRDLETAFGSDSIYAHWFKWAHQADAGTRLYMNENEILAQAGSDSLSFERFKGIIERLNAAGAPLHGIGVQGHMKYGLTPPQRLLEIFDELAGYGKEISITEYDAVNINDDLAADYMRDILIAVFSHPAARNFIMWGFWDGAHWQNDAPLFNRDWSLKPSGKVFMDYVFNQWWSEANGASDKHGRWAARVFYGTYDVTVRLKEVSQQTQAVFTPSSQTLVVVMDTDMTAPEPPTGLILEQNYPNPFSEQTKIRYGLPQRSPVTLDVFNINGRQVINHVDGSKAPGWHEVMLDAEELPSGVYYYRLCNGQTALMRKMLLIK